ncbi:MAG: DUF2911 domain-containing protein, partial [Gemmatimonadota bacterium]|nr:DUF2911 domain-containing protein [Gemmatimonadota bacterium]
MKTLPPALLAAAVLMIGAAPVHAQVRGSEHALVQQTVDGTTITVDYSRPQIRGRTPAFGRMVDFGHEWTPGANWATIIEFDKPVKMNGRSIEAGRYSMWMTAQPDEFEIMLDPTDSIFHTMRPAPHDAQIRI